MMLGVTELVVQTGEARFVVDCKVNPVKFVNHIKTVFEPEGVKIIDGWSMTVRVASALLTLPAALVTTTLYWAASEGETLTSLKDELGCWGMGLTPLYHW